MIIFTIEASNYIKAGEIEKALKDAGLRYDARMPKSPARTTATGRKKRRTPEASDVKDILAYIATHSDESNKKVAKHFGFGDNTIWRIRNGTHALCKLVKGKKR